MKEGFYKNDNGQLFCGSSVYSTNYTLFSDNKDSYVYPIDGWYWFDTLEEACNYFQLDIKKYTESEEGTLLNGFQPTLPN